MKCQIVEIMRFFNSFRKKVRTKMFQSLIASQLILGAAVFGLWTPDLDRSELEKKYATPNTRFEDVHGQTVHYQVSGSKDSPVILMLHGFGSSLQTWDAWTERLNKNYRVIVVDLPGFGLTGPSPAHAYSDADDVEFIENFVQKLNIPEFVLIGHSMGAKIAWNVAASYPNQVKKLVLIAPDGFSNAEEIGKKPYEVSIFVRLMKFCLPKFLVKKSIEPAFFDANALTDQLLERYFDFLRAPGVRQAIIERAEQTINSDPVDRLKKITAPTLLLWGDSDQMIPKENALAYAKILAHSSTVVLPRQGHVLQEERPNEGLDPVLVFLNQAD
jgi:pimeloyl-ACP methyl ester carboxylesterase